MTVAELMSVLSEMDPTNLVVIGHLPHGSADMDYMAAGDSVYFAIVEIDGASHNAVVIDTREAAGR